MNKKSLTLFALLALLCNVMQAYDYKPFVEDGKVWHLEYSTYDWENDEYISHYFDYKIDGDTTIAGIVCKKLYALNIDRDREIGYKMALYEVDHKVYKFKRGTQELELLYDFSNLTIGDELGYVDECRIVKTHGCERRAYHFVGEGLGGWWVEGVGSTTEPFSDPKGFGAAGLIVHTVNCKLNGLPIFDENDFQALQNWTGDWRPDVNADGAVDIDDVNAVINKILHK